MHEPAFLKKRGRRERGETSLDTPVSAAIAGYFGSHRIPVIGGRTTVPIPIVTNERGESTYKRINTIEPSAKRVRLVAITRKERLTTSTITT